MTEGYLKYTTQVEFDKATKKEIERIKNIEIKYKKAIEALKFIKSNYGGYEKEIDAGYSFCYISDNIIGQNMTKARQTLKDLGELP